MDYREFERAAVEAAVAAGRLVRPWAGRARGVTRKTSVSDLVTDLDREAEAEITAALRASFPEHDIWGEESGGQAERRFVWHVDPIDGTTNFVHGLPGYCVSVALADGGRPVAGAVYDPTADELFSACAGGGARVDGRPLHVAAGELGEALLGTGIPTRQPYRDVTLGVLPAVCARVRNVRNLGAAALHLSYVAAGRLTGFWEPTLNPWDCAAGVILVREAGGRATDLAGEEWHAGVRGVVATNGTIHEPLLALLAGGPH